MDTWVCQSIHGFINNIYNKLGNNDCWLHLLNTSVTLYLASVRVSVKDVKKTQGN